MQARWNPPTPRIATILPASSSAAVSRIGSLQSHRFRLDRIRAESGAAVLAGDCLRMVAPGVRVAILPRTCRAHREVCHGCPLAVVRDLLMMLYRGPQFTQEVAQ